jgi:hypothetical protein
MPSSSLALLFPPLLCWGGQGDNDDNDDNLRGDENINDVRPHLPNTQHPAIVGGGGGGGNKDGKEEEYDGCWRTTGKVALALAKRRGGYSYDNDALCFGFDGDGMPPMMPLLKRGQRQQRQCKMTYAFLVRGTRCGNNGQLINN